MQKMNDITGEDGDETWRVCKIDQLKYKNGNATFRNRSSRWLNYENIWGKGFANGIKLLKKPDVTIIM